MNFFQGVTKPMEYLNEKSDKYGNNAIKPALIWSISIALLPVICFALIFSIIMQLSNGSVNYDNLITNTGRESGGTSILSGAFGAGILFLYIFACMWLNSWIVTMSAKIFDGKGTTSNQLIVSIWSGIPAMIAIIALFIIYGLIAYLTQGTGLQIIFGFIFSVASTVLYFIYSICSVSASQRISKSKAFGSIVIAIISVFSVVFLLSLLANLIF